MMDKEIYVAKVWGEFGAVHVVGVAETMSVAIDMCLQSRFDDELQDHITCMNVVKVPVGRYSTGTLVWSQMVDG